jgi:hypothetical protein
MVTLDNDRDGVTKILKRKYKKNLVIFFIITVTLRVHEITK